MTKRELFDLALPQALAIARGWARNGRGSAEELEQAAMRALWFACLSHRPERGDFLQYARVKVRFGLRDFAREEHGLTRRMREHVRLGRLQRPEMVRDALDDLPASFVDPHEALVLRRAFAALPTRLRALVERRHARGEKMGDIAASLGVSASRASQMYATAVERMCAHLTP